MATIVTDAFILRPVRESDAEDYFYTMQDVQTKISLQSVPLTIFEARHDIMEMLREVDEKDSEIFTIEINGKYAGNILLQHQDFDISSRDGRIHLWMHPEYRGKGLGTYAIQEILKYALKSKFDRVFAQCKSSNKAVCRVLEKCRFREMKRFLNEAGEEKIFWVREKED